MSKLSVGENLTNWLTYKGESCLRIKGWILTGDVNIGTCKRGLTTAEKYYTKENKIEFGLAYSLVKSGDPLRKKVDNMAVVPLASP